MSTGHAEDTTRYLHEEKDGDWVKAFLARPVEYEPGTHFLYNSGATYMLSAIVQKLSGLKVVDYLRPRLFEPLGIENPTWETCPRGINTGGWGLNIKTEDIARFGQLYLQKGMWHGQRLVPAAWIEEATARQVSNGSNPDSDWEQGYGYQFWRCRHNAYRGDGAFGQYCLVMPDQDAVLAITSGVSDMQAVLNVIWARLLPAMSSAPLPAAEQAQAALDRKLAALSLSPQPGPAASAVAAHVTDKRYVFPANDQGLKSIAFAFGAKGCTLTVSDQECEQQILCGAGVWSLGTTRLSGIDPRRNPGDAPSRIAASGAWTAEDTYVAKIYVYETPFCLTLTSRFTEDKVLFDAAVNVSFGPVQRPQLIGQAV